MPDGVRTEQHVMPTVTIPHHRHTRPETIRKVRQAAMQALDLLGVALAGHGHNWTQEERSAYEVAVRMLRVPKEDREHLASVRCWCEPRVQDGADGADGRIVLHTAMDGRA